MRSIWSENTCCESHADFNDVIERVSESTLPYEEILNQKPKSQILGRSETYYADPRMS